jgi:hypothetical protein
MSTKLETQLDKFIAVESKEFDMQSTNHTARHDFTAGAKSMKPMVLKLVSSLEQVSAGREKYQTRVEMDVSDMKELANEALNELTKLIGQGD